MRQLFREHSGFAEHDVAGGWVGHKFETWQLRLLNVFGVFFGFTGEDKKFWHGRIIFGSGDL